MNSSQKKLLKKNYNPLKSFDYEILLCNSCWFNFIWKMFGRGT